MVVLVAAVDLNDEKAYHPAEAAMIIITATTMYVSLLLLFEETSLLAFFEVCGNGI